MDEYKEQLHTIAYSKETYAKIVSIGDRYHLLIDQLGELAAEIRDILTGPTLSKNLVVDLTSRLEISQQTAEKIAIDINTEIFEPLKDAMRKTQEEKERIAMAPVPPQTPRPVSSSIEHVGGFTVVNRPPSNSPLYNDSSLQREEVLHDLENIEKLKPQNANNYVEHLLGNSVPSAPPAAPVPNYTPQSPRVETPKKPVPPYLPRPDGVDPYREEV